MKHIRFSAYNRKREKEIQTYFSKCGSILAAILGYEITIKKTHE
jgi:hypothetical protein